ncbi:hypothetical protein BKA66DRAFT_383784, partial [Pyrenochaeta sp. MPI-SDFR-AT-0127]
ACFTAVKKAFNRADNSDLAVLMHCLGLQSLPNLPPLARELSEHINVIGIDTEHWSSNTTQMTEVGVTVFSVQEMVRIARSQNYGPHGANMMDRIKFYLFRILETSHLPNTNPASKGVNGNRFGRDRFVTYSEMRDILGFLFNQTVKRVNGSENTKQPVIILGHAIAHDKNNLKTKELAFDLEKCDSIVRFIDTQQLVRDAGYWLHRSNNIGLGALTTKLGFQHHDPHTACNDIAHTTIAAFQIALYKGRVAKMHCQKNLIQVVADLETSSRDTYQHIGGSEKYCWKCCSRLHMIYDCPMIDLRCDECWSNGRTEEAATHVTMHCERIAWERAAQRREKDAAARQER